MKLFLDIETNSTFNVIWMCWSYDEENGYVCHTTGNTLIPLINKADKVIAHNLIGFDGPILNRLWGTNLSSKNSMDTLVMSRLAKPDIEGGHSLEAWGQRLGKKKSDYQRIYWRLKGVREFDKDDKSHWDNPNIPLMSAYCKRDVEVLVRLHKELEKALDGWGESVELEHQVAAIIKRQEDHGFRFDMSKAMNLLATLSCEVGEIEEKLQGVFPPIVEEMKTPEYYMVQGLKAATKAELKEKLKQLGLPQSKANDAKAGPMKTRVIPFNPGSRQQIAERLMGLGVQFDRHTEKGAVVVDEKVLADIDLPEAKLLARYLLLQKRVSQVKSWFEAVGDDHRIHGRVITNGAVTGRMTHHSPNMAQVPNSGSEYGPECRECFTVDEGYSLVGADASGLELRMLAHCMRDEAYVKTVVEGSSKDGTDVHTQNQKAAGLPTRDHAKTFIYAFLYGAGPKKIGSIVGGGAETGKKLMARFLRATPALKTLRDKVAKYADKGYVPGLDGRKIWVRSEHAALNSLLQGAGAVVLKKALVILDKKIRHAKIDAHFCANVHDEWQIEVESSRADEVGAMAVASIQEAGEYFELRCPLTGEYNVGKTWKDTH